MKKQTITLLLLITIFLLSACSNTFPESDYVLVASPGTEEYIPGILTPTYEFNNQLPGPTIYAEINKELSVLAYNNISEDITIHWHGMQLPNGMDGVPGVTQKPIRPKQSFLYTYTPINPGIYWYHSHVDAHKQVEMGLQGPIIVNDPLNEIPTDTDTILVLDDVALDNTGNYRSFDLNYMHGRFGNVMLVNGETNPQFNLAGKFHRFRLINTANARSFYLNFGGNNITIIGEDIGYVNPYTVQRLAIHPGERYDIIIETTNTFQLEYSTSRERVPLAYMNIQEPQYESPEFNIPSFAEEELPEEAYTMQATYTLELQGVRDANYGLVWNIGGKNSLTNPGTFSVEEGKLTKIKLVNTQGQPHPMHLHGQKFIIISRNGQTAEQGWKDSLMIGSRETVEIAFIPEEKGEWVFHCHILEHAKAGMLTSITIK